VTWLVSQAIRRKQILNDLQIDLGKESAVGERQSIMAILWTMSVTGMGIYVGVNAFELHSAILFCVSIVIIGAEQHRISIIQHEAIHRLLFRSVHLNDYVGLFFLGGTLGILPHASREAHMSHHKSLGTAIDQERMPYLSAPKNGLAFVKWCIVKLTAVDGVLRVAKLLAGLFSHIGDDAFHGSAAQNTKNTFRRFDWIILIVIQLGLLATFHLFIGYRYYLLLWLFPLFTVTRLLVAIRSISEHWANEQQLDCEARYLNSVYCNRIERFLFAPYYFNYHAEHHFFPSIPSWRLPKLSKVLRNHSEFRRGVVEHNSYIFFLCEYYRNWCSNSHGADGISIGRKLP